MMVKVVENMQCLTSHVPVHHCFIGDAPRHVQVLPPTTEYQCFQTHVCVSIITNAQTFKSLHLGNSSFGMQVHFLEYLGQVHMSRSQGRESVFVYPICGWSNSD